MKHASALLTSTVRSLLVVGAIALGLVGAGGSPVPVQAEQNGIQGVASSDSLITGVQVQNLSSTAPANVQLAYYSPDGSLAPAVAGMTNPQNDQIAAGQSQTYFGRTLAVGSGFQGSVVVSADQPVSAITNVIALDASTGANLGGDAYDGVLTPGNPVYVPLVQWNNGTNNETNSTIAIQNTSSTPTTVSLAFASASPSYPTILTSSVPVAGHGSLEIGSGQISGLNNQRWVGSVTISATNGAQLAVVVNQSDRANHELLSYTGSTDGSRFVYAPLIETNHSRTYRYFTGFQVQNTNTTTPAQVYLYVNTVPTTCGDPGYVDTLTLSPLGSKTWFPVPGTTNVSDFLGSATACTPNGTLIGAVNEVTGAGATVTGQGATYNAFNDTKATSVVSMPLVENDHSGYYTGQQVQNVGSAPETVYVYPGEVPTTGCGTGAPAASQTLSPGQSANWFPLPGLAVGPATSASACVATGKIVGIVHEIRPGYQGDNSYLYEGFNQ